MDVEMVREGYGRISISAAKMVGDDDVVYALDIHPLASYKGS